MAGAREGLTSSIRVVANRTGIGPHTLRVWERRYGFPAPERRADGVRAYSEADIMKLRLVARALAAGFRASEVVPLSAADLARIVDATMNDLETRSNGTNMVRSEAPRVDRRDSGDDASEPVARVIAAVRSDDIEAVQAILRSEARSLGPKRFVTEVADPLAIRVGELWQGRTLEVRHEHILSACLTRELHAFSAEQESKQQSPVVVLATLPGEHHLLPLEMAAVYLAASGARTRMLGADTPVREIAASARAMKAEVVGLSISAAASPTDARAAVRELLDELPRRVKVWLGGAGSGAVFGGIDERGVVHVASCRALDQRLKEVGA